MEKTQVDMLKDIKNDMSYLKDSAWVFLNWEH